ncbi:MAG: TIGR02530 family flagellar biosynthesis protein [Acutalibacter sp.]|jgi:flagellar operon protein
MIRGVSQGSALPSSREQVQQSGNAQTGFGQVFQQELQKAAAPVQSGVAFSKHAAARAEQRGIEVTPALMAQLSQSVERAQEKGATNILAMDSTRAFIINVPNARVITAITQDEMKENVFTNIDGAVFLKDQ